MKKNLITIISIGLALSILVGVSVYSLSNKHVKSSDNFNKSSQVKNFDFSQKFSTPSENVKSDISKGEIVVNKSKNGEQVPKVFVENGTTGASVQPETK